MVFLWFEVHCYWLTIYDLDRKEKDVYVVAKWYICMENPSVKLLVLAFWVHVGLRPCASWEPYGIGMNRWDPLMGQKQNKK